MADFKEAYEKYVKPIEGGYGWYKADSGGETYAGIARNYNPTWSGWSIIDLIKQTTYKGKPNVKPDFLSPIPHNSKFPELNASVEGFYFNLWDSAKLGQIKDQKVANIAFDWLVNSGGSSVRTKGPETYGIDEILIDRFGQNIPVDSKFDQTTIDSINRVDNNRLYNEIIKERKRFYDVIVKNDPTQEKFYNGWMNRINRFSPVTIAIGGLGLLLAIVGLAIYLTYK